MTNELMLWFWASFFAFIAHNLEERRTMEEWAAKNLPPSLSRFYKKTRFTRAVILIGLVYFLAILWNQMLVDQNKTSIFANTVLLVGLYAIVGNAIIHLLQAVFVKNGMPGKWSAIFLLLPIGAFISYRLINLDILSPLELTIYFCLGFLFQFPVIMISFLLTKPLEKNTPRAKDQR